MELQEDYDDTNLTMDVGTAPIRPYELNAWVVCPRKCWFIQRQLMMEPHSPFVELGRLIHQEVLHERPRHETAFTEVPIEGFARIDKIAGDPEKKMLVYEIKRSPRKQEAHRLQLLYYLYLLRERGLNLKGVLSYPEQNRREIVELDEEGLQTLQNALECACKAPSSIDGSNGMCLTAPPSASTSINWRST